MYNSKSNFELNLPNFSWERNLSRLCASGTAEQIDHEILFFTNTDIATKPRMPVRGLWILKFVQCKYRRNSDSVKLIS